MKARDLKKLLDRVDPEAEVLGTTDDLAQWHHEVEQAYPARLHSPYFAELRWRCTPRRTR